jgi:tetratricopeptide (TPR) repeat protein
MRLNPADGWRRRISALCVLGIAAAWALPARSQSGGAESICTGRTDASAEERVRACSSLIDSRSFIGDQLAILYTSRGSGWRAQGDVDRALADQNEAVRLQPGSAIVYFNRAVTWQSKHQADRAILDYSEAIRLAPNFVLAYKNRGDAFFTIADYDRAITDYDSALRLKPDYAEAVARRGLAKLQKGDPDGRNADLRAARSIDPAIIASLFDPQGIARSMGQGFMVRKDLKVFTALELSEASICMQADAASEEQLRKYFDAHSMKYTARAFPTFDEARQAYDRGDCDVLAANIAALAAARLKLTRPENHAPLPEVFAASAHSTPTPQVAPAPATDCAQAETHWKSAEEIKTLAAYQDHLARFANCAFATIARIKIDQLKNEALRPPPAPAIAVTPSPPPAVSAAPSAPSTGPRCGWYAIFFCSRSQSEAANWPRERNVGFVISTDSSDYPNFRAGWYCAVEGPMPRSEALREADRFRQFAPTAYAKNAC